MTDSMIKTAIRAVGANLAAKDSPHEGYADACENHEGVLYDKVTLDGEFDLKSIVRAVLLAIREPDESMMRAGLEMGWFTIDDGEAIVEAEAVWQAMLDAILKEAS